MRRWQVAKLREAGLDPYMRGTWQEAQAAIAAAQRAREIMQVEVAHELMLHEQAQQSIPAIDAPTEPAAPVFPPASDRMCPHCGKLCKHPQALKWHLRGCSERPRPEAAT